MKSYSVFITGVAGVLLLGMLNYVAGYELGFFVFYYIPVAIVAWHLGSTAGFLISVLSAAVWFLADSFAGHSYSSGFYAWWNTGIRLVSFLVIAASFSIINKLLRKAREELDTLRGFLRVCSACRKVENPDGQWVPMELFFEDKTAPRFTHTLCPQCADKWHQTVHGEEKLKGEAI